MRYPSLRIIMALSVLMALSIGLAFAQTNATEANVTGTNITEANITKPSVAETNVTETMQPSQYTQLSNRSSAPNEALGRNAVSRGYSDVSKLTANISDVFSTNPAIGVNITSVNIAQKWIAITNEEVAGSQDLSGWTLVSGGNATYTFPALTLNSGDSVKVHEGTGTSSETDLYTNSDAPLWTGNEVSLINAAGSIVSTYTIPASQAPAKWVNPLSSLIQY